MSLEDLKTYIEIQVKKEVENKVQEELQKEKYKIEQNTLIQNALKTEDISSSVHLNTDLVEARQEVLMTKSGNTIVLSAYLTVINDFSSSERNFILTVDEKYKPKNAQTVTIYRNNPGSIFGGSFRIDGTISTTSVETKGTILRIENVWQI